MPSSMKPKESRGPNGPSSVNTKAKAIFWYFTPDLPEFPLPPDLVEKVQALPGPLPTTLQEFLQVATSEYQPKPSPETP